MPQSNQSHESLWGTDKESFIILALNRHRAVEIQIVRSIPPQGKLPTAEEGRKLREEIAVQLRVRVLRAGVLKQRDKGHDQLLHQGAVVRRHQPLQERVKQ